MSEIPRNLLGEHTEALLADVLDKREEALINTVIAKLVGGHTLEPQFAIQAWVSLYEQRALRRTLIQRTKTENARLPAKA